MAGGEDLAARGAGGSVATRRRAPSQGACRTRARVFRSISAPIRCRSVENPTVRVGLSTLRLRAVSATILIVDDEREIRELLRYNLERQGYQVLTAKDGEEGLARIFATHPDLVLLDLLLPGLNGLEVLREVRAEPSTRDLPVLLLTARGAEMDKLLGFERGADDYITKPFSPREVIARVEAVLRRVLPARDSEAVEAGALTLDHARREARVGGVELTLTPREFELLYFLAKNPGRVFSRDELLTKVWGYDYRGETRTVDVHVRRLRVKLGEETARMIATVTGAGYKFVVK
jgi:phosphate regulon transcriptional regulator PhoB